MIGIAIGLAAMLLGAKGFGREGLPLTRRKRLTGRGAKVVGASCLLIGLAFVVGGVYSVYVITGRGS